MESRALNNGAQKSSSLYSNRKEWKTKGETSVRKVPNGMAGFLEQGNRGTIPREPTLKGALSSVVGQAPGARVNAG